MSGVSDGLQFGDYADAGLLKADGSYSEPGVQVDLSGLVGNNLKVGGVFHVECIRPDGTTRWVDDFKNSLTNVALDDILNVYLAAQSAQATWYIGLVDNASFTAYAAADTMSSHAGWVESQAYSNSTRIAWGNGTSTGGAGSMTNASTVNFSINGTATIRGLFLTSNSTKGGTTGTLFATANFTGGNQAVANGDTLKVTYTVTSTTS